MHKNGMLHETLVALFADCSLHWLYFSQANIRKRGSKLSTSPDLTQFVRTNLTSINSGAPPTVAGDLELVCTIAATHMMMALCKCDASFAARGSKLCKFTDLRQLVSITCTNINSGAQPVMAGDLGLMRSNTSTHVRLNVTGINCGSTPTVPCGLELVCPTEATHEMMAKCSVNSGAPPTVTDDLELVCTMAATHTMMAFCKCNASIAAGGSNLCKFTDLRQLVTGIIFANINSGAPPVVADDLGLMRSNSATHVRLILPASIVEHRLLCHAVLCSCAPPSLTMRCWLRAGMT